MGTKFGREQQTPILIKILESGNSRPERASKCDFGYWDVPLARAQASRNSRNAIIAQTICFYPTPFQYTC